MIHVSNNIVLQDQEIELSFICASGPGGQNVNKVSTAVQLRFDVAHSPSLPEAVRRRTIALCGRRLTDNGVLIIQARRFRTQQKNRIDAIERLVDLIRKALHPPKPRHKTKPTAGSKRRRLESKSQRSDIKRQRRQTGDD